MGTGRGQVVSGAGQRGRSPYQPAGGIGKNLHVDAVTVVFAAVVRLLVGDPVDRDQRAVQDRVHQDRCPVDGGVQVVGQGSEQVDSATHVAPRGAGTDPEPSRQPGVGIAIAQMRQHQQRLPTRVQSTPP